MKPRYSILKKNHYSSNELSASFVDKKILYREIGYDSDDLIRRNPAYENTCAIRMSLALIQSGVFFSGRLKIKDGVYKGRLVEAGAKLLADQLSLSQIFGPPQIFSPVVALSKLAGKQGVVFFWKIEGYNGGHIDLIETADSLQVCNSACYFSSREIWFSALD